MARTLPLSIHKPDHSPKPPLGLMKNMSTNMSQLAFTKSKQSFPGNNCKEEVQTMKPSLADFLLPDGELREKEIKRRDSTLDSKIGTIQKTSSSQSMSSCSINGTFESSKMNESFPISDEAVEPNRNQTDKKLRREKVAKDRIRQMNRGSSVRVLLEKLNTSSNHEKPIKNGGTKERKLEQNGDRTQRQTHEEMEQIETPSTVQSTMSESYRRFDSSSLSEARQNLLLSFDSSSSESFNNTSFISIDEVSENSLNIDELSEGLTPASSNTNIEEITTNHEPRMAPLNVRQSQRRRGRNQSQTDDTNREIDAPSQPLGRSGNRTTHIERRRAFANTRKAHSSRSIQSSDSELSLGDFANSSHSTGHFGEPKHASKMGLSATSVEFDSHNKMMNSSGHRSFMRKRPTQVAKNRRAMVVANLSRKHLSHRTKRDQEENEPQPSTINDSLSSLVSLNIQHLNESMSSFSVQDELVSCSILNERQLSSSLHELSPHDLIESTPSTGHHSLGMKSASWHTPFNPFKFNRLSSG